MTRKPTIADLQAYVDGEISSLDSRLQEVEDSLRAAQTPGPGSDDSSDDDILYRSKAIREATVRLNVIAGPFQELGPYVDEVLKIAGFILGENNTAPVTIYNDHYHYDTPEFVVTPENVVVRPTHNWSPDHIVNNYGSGG